MTFLPLFSLALCGVDPLHACGTFRAVFGPVGTGGKQRPTYGAFLRIQPVEQRRFQFLILRLYRRPKPPAQQGTEELKISERTLYRKIKEYNLE